MKQVIIYTQAYNAAKTLKRAMESILNQSYEKFVYYVLDNGSNDNTWNIIQSYANRDQRIVPLHNIGNNMWSEGRDWLSFLLLYNDNDYFCMLDADDEYHRNFLERMLNFMNKFQLDIAACGSDFIHAVDNTILGKRIVTQDLIIEENGFLESYIIYHQFMRTIWGKLFPVGVMRHVLESKAYLRFGNPAYGSDTLVTQEAFREVKRVGILSESLHKYYSSKNSDSYYFNSTRIVSDRILFESSKEYLNAKCVGVLPVNYQFILEVYSMAIVDTMNVIIKSYLTLESKLEGILDILKSTQTRELMENVHRREALLQCLKKITKWIIHQKEAIQDNNRSLVADIFAVLEKVPEKEIGWDTSDYLLLLIAIRSKGFNSELLDRRTDEAANEIMLLMGLNGSFFLHFREITECVAKGKIDKALYSIWNIIEREEDIPDIYVKQFLDLGLNLSAKLEKNKDFIYLKKLKIQYLINTSKPELALEELSDWDEILPEDVDFALFKSLLNK